MIDNCKIINTKFADSIIKSEIILLNNCPAPIQLPSPTAMKKLFRILFVENNSILHQFIRIV